MQQAVSADESVMQQAAADEGNVAAMQALLVLNLMLFVQLQLRSPVMRPSKGHLHQQ